MRPFMLVRILRTLRTRRAPSRRIGLLARPPRPRMLEHLFVECSRSSKIRAFASRPSRRRLHRSTRWEDKQRRFFPDSQLCVFVLLLLQLPSNSSEGGGLCLRAGSSIRNPIMTFFTERRCS